MSDVDPCFVAWVDQAQRDWLDTDGRPLGEVASPAYPPETRLGACPYAGARAGKPMNLDAMEQVRAHRDVVLATLTAHRPVDPTVSDVLRLCTGTLVAPLFGPRPVPAAMSALYKTTLGFHQVLVSLLLDSPGLAAQPATELPGADALLAALEGGGWLVGQSQVCAGSPGEIALSWEVLCGRRDGPAVEPLPLSHADWAVEATGLILALVLATHERLARGEREGLDGFGVARPKVEAWPLGARLWHRRPAPWIVAATALPTRTACFVERLFVVPPAGVSRLSHSSGGHAELERSFWKEAQQLRPSHDGA